MTVNLSALAGAGQQFFDDNGVPLTGGKLYSYEAGTTTPQATYTTVAGNVAHTNPIVLDSAGRVPGGQILLTSGDSYKFVLYTANDVLIASWDNITGIDGTGIATNAVFVSYDPAGSGAVQTTVQEVLRRTVSPKDFGAVGDGATNDLAAVKLALESGKVVDGGGLTYAISGTCTPTSFVGLQNANFIQIGNNAATNFNTLNIVGFNNFFIDNVTINMGTNVTTLFADDGNNGLYVAGAAYNSSSKNFRISRVTVTGNGCGTGIHVRHAEWFTLDNCLVRDRIAGANPDPTNDSQNGIQINNCANFVLSNTNVYNLQTRLSGVDSRKWTRGILFVEIRDSSINGCNVTNVDQGYDFSGGYDAGLGYIGNRRWTIGNCTANNCLSYGFKFANVTREGLVTGCIANNIGTIGFVFSPSAVALPLGLEKYNTQDIDVVGCKVVNVLGNGWSSANAQGFRMMAGGAYPEYPQGIRLKSCNVIDNQDTPTTSRGYASDVNTPQYPDVGYNFDTANTTQGCTVGGNVTLGYDGTIGPNVCVLTSTAVQPIANETWTAVQWDAEISDPLRLHNPASSNNIIFIKTAGWYELDAQIEFAADPNGIRGVRFVRSGVLIDRSAVQSGPASGATTLTVRASVVEYFPAGSNASVEVFQNRGSPMNVLTNESRFSVTLVS